MYIVDQYNNRIRKVTISTGTISTIAGTGSAGFSGDGGSATSGKFEYPSSVAIDASGNLYIGDYNRRIRKVTISTDIISTIAGTGAFSYTGDGGPATSASFKSPEGVAVDASGTFYFTL